MQLSSSCHCRHPALSMNHSEVARGIALSVVASSLFALLYAYTQWLAPLSGIDIFAWRIVWTLPAAAALLAWRGQFPLLLAALRELIGHPRQALLIALTASLLGLQLWLFMWAPLNGRALDVSLGYFLMPLVMVLLGRFYYHERLDIWQCAAIACALFGVTHELWMTRAFSWPSLVVALCYPPYFMLRRHLKMDSLILFTLEMLMLTPPALLMLWHSPTLSTVLQRPGMLLLLPGLGLLSTLALASFLRASRLLPLGLFGILGYVEPVLLVVVATLLFGESLSTAQLWTYAPIWLSVGFTAIHSVRLMQRR
jgi:chloramphenicol-sensitive protein RarD